jgi:hypothetical protein
VDKNILEGSDELTVAIKRQGSPARQFIPYAQYCHMKSPAVLNPGESLYESLFPAAGLSGWEIAEPGYYVTQACLHLGDEDVVSNPMIMRITPPQGYEEEFLAQDFFSDDVGRILTFDGSQVLSGGINTLQEVSDRLKKKRVSSHALIALGRAKAIDYKLLDLKKDTSPLMSAAEAGGKIKISPASKDEARKELTRALEPEFAETLGHVDYKWYADRFTDWLEKQGENNAAQEIQETLMKTLSTRGVKKEVLDDIVKRRDSFKKKGKDK